MPDLRDYGLGKPQVPDPHIRREYIIQSPHTGKIAGFLGKEIRRSLRVYTTLRRQNHFFHSESAYAVSDRILDILQMQDVSHIYVHEGTEGSEADVFEFTTRQYVEDGQPVPTEFLEERGDPQTWVAVDDATNHWQDFEIDHLFVHEFREACERIDWRGYDPKLKERKQ